MSDEVLVKSYRLAANVELSKCTAVVADTGTYSDGCAVPAASNAAKPLGIASSSIMPSGVVDYTNGQYVLTSGTSWPAGALGTGLGRAVRVVRKGITQVRISGTVTRGDRLNIAGSDGRLKTVNELAGTTVNVVGIAEESGVDGDVIRVNVDPYITVV